MDNKTKTCKYVQNIWMIYNIQYFNCNNNQILKTKTIIWYI